ncbi:MAG: LysE family translocator [Magnetovibrionaceae bacterium]
MAGTDLLAYVILVVVLVVSPGPNSLLLTKTVPLSGRGAGTANAIGFVTGFYVHGLLAFFGLSLILLRSAEWFLVLKLLGAAYLAWIGLSSLWQALKDDGKPGLAVKARRKRTIWMALSEGFLTNALNPKVALFYLAAFPQFIPAGEGGFVGAVLLVSIHAVIAGLWFAGIILFLDRLSASSRSGTVRRLIKGVTGAVFIGFAVKLATFRAAP